MTKRKKIRCLFSAIRRGRLGHEDIKKFSSDIIELMAESGIPPSKRREFYRYVQDPSQDMDRIIESAHDAMSLILQES